MSIRSLCIAADLDRPTTESFIGMRATGIDLAVVCPPGHPNRRLLEESGVPLVDIALRRRFDAAGIRALREELCRGRYHILHTYTNPAISNGLRATRGLPIRIVCYRGIAGAESFFDPMSWMRYLNPRVDRIICVADAIRQAYLEMQPAMLRLPAERLVTIYKGHKLDWYRAEPADLQTVGVPEGAFVVGCAATYRPRKGIEYLVDAVARLPGDVHLLLVGHMDAAKLDDSIANSGIADRVHRVGFRRDAPSLSAACDVFCLPSTKREGLPRSVIEAMAYRVPPVVTAVGGSPELVVDGECGFVVPPKDAVALATAIERLYKDARLRRRLGDAARERIGRDFRNEDTVARTMELYKTLVPDPQAQRRWPG